MIKRKKLLIYFLAGILLTLFLTTCHHFLNNLTVADRAKVKIAASNGEKFTIVYTLHNFPDESYSLEIRDKFGDAIGVFSGDGRGKYRIFVFAKNKMNLSYNGMFDFYIE